MDWKTKVRLGFFERRMFPDFACNNRFSKDDRKDNRRDGKYNNNNNKRDHRNDDRRDRDRGEKGDYHKPQNHH